MDVEERAMGKLIVTMWMSLDGYIAGPNDNMSWIRVDDEMGAYEGALVGAADTLVLGRVTYQSFAGAWPHVPDNPAASEGEKEYARTLNAMRKVVFSRTLDQADWHNSTLLRAITPDEIVALKREAARDLVIYGSASVVQALTRHGLIDEYQLLLHPIVLGGGKRLFSEQNAMAAFQLVDTRTFGSGVVLLTYRPTSDGARATATGS
jgi:dihydrofolate reductase